MIYRNAIIGIDYFAIKLFFLGFGFLELVHQMVYVLDSEINVVNAGGRDGDAASGEDLQCRFDFLHFVGYRRMKFGLVTEIEMIVFHSILERKMPR